MDWDQDTTPAAREVYLDAIRRMSLPDRLRATFAMIQLTMTMQEADVRRMYPEASDREVFLRAAERRLGSELVKKVYGWQAPEMAKTAGHGE